MDMRIAGIRDDIEALQGGVNTDVDIANVIADPQSATSVTLSERYLQGSPDLLSKLPTPFYVSHRGGPRTGPEMTMELYRINAATGIDVLEADVQPTSDGGLITMHDSTVDRTTDGTGPVADYSLPAMLALNAAAKVPWPRAIPPATLQQFLAEFGPQRVLMLEPKDPATLENMLDAAESAGVENSVLVETSSPTVAQRSIERGYQVWFYWGSTITSPTVQSVVDLGVQHLAAARPISDADTQALVATGLPVTIYGIDRRWDRDRYLALGVAGISSDNPTYVKSDIAFQKRDSWIRGVWGQGLNTNRTNLPAIENGALTLSILGGAPEIITPGEVLPIANKNASYSIDVDLGWKTLPSDLTRALQVQFCIPDDRQYNFASPSLPEGFPGAYLVHFRANGSLEFYKFTASNPQGSGTAGAPVVTVSTPALTAGSFAHLRISVTPTGLTITRTDTNSTPITSSDTAYRGGHIALTRYSTADGVGQFKNLVIS